MLNNLTLYKKYKLFGIISIFCFIIFITYENTVILIIGGIIAYWSAMVKCPKCNKYLGKNKFGYYSIFTLFDDSKCTKCGFDLDTNYNNAE